MKKQVQGKLVGDTRGFLLPWSYGVIGHVSGAVGVNSMEMYGSVKLWRTVNVMLKNLTS